MVSRSFFTLAFAAGLSLTINTSVYAGKTNSTELGKPSGTTSISTPTSIVTQSKITAPSTAPVKSPTLAAPVSVVPVVTTTTKTSTPTSTASTPVVVSNAVSKPTATPSYPLATTPITNNAIPSLSPVDTSKATSTSTINKSAAVTAPAKTTASATDPKTMADPKAMTVAVPDEGDDFGPVGHYIVSKSPLDATNDVITFNPDGTPGALPPKIYRASKRIQILGSVVGVVGYNPDTKSLVFFDVESSARDAREIPIEGLVTTNAAHIDVNPMAPSLNAAHIDVNPMAPGMNAAQIDVNPMTPNAQ